MVLHSSLPKLVQTAQNTQITPYHPNITKPSPATVACCYSFLVHNKRTERLIVPNSVGFFLFRNWITLWTGHTLVSSFSFPKSKSNYTISWQFWILFHGHNQCTGSLSANSGRCSSHWTPTIPHYVDIGTPRATGSLWSLSCNWEYNSRWGTNWLKGL